MCIVAANRCEEADEGVLGEEVEPSVSQPRGGREEGVHVAQCAVKAAPHAIESVD